MLKYSLNGIRALQAYSNSTGGEDKEAEIEKEEGADSDED